VKLPHKIVILFAALFAAAPAMADVLVDNVNGYDGSDIFYFGAALTAQDVVQGGAGDDTIVLQGDYGWGLVLSRNVTGIEASVMLPSSSKVSTCSRGRTPSVQAWSNRRDAWCVTSVTFSDAMR